MNQFPQTPEYTIRAVSNFFKNSRTYSQLKMHHRCRWHWWQMGETFIIKILIILFGHLWEVELTYRYIFAFKFTLVANLPPCCWYRWQFCHRCCWYQWCTLTCEYLREFLKKIKTGYSGAGGKLIHEKTRSKKSRDTVPLSRFFICRIKI